MNVQKTLIIVKPAIAADLILSKKAEVEILKLGYTIIAVNGSRGISIFHTQNLR